MSADAIFPQTIASRARRMVRFDAAAMGLGFATTLILVNRSTGWFPTGLVAIHLGLAMAWTVSINVIGRPIYKTSQSRWFPSLNDATSSRNLRRGQLLRRRLGAYLFWVTPTLWTTAVIGKHALSPDGQEFWLAGYLLSLEAIQQIYWWVIEPNI